MSWICGQIIKKTFMFHDLSPGFGRIFEYKKLDPVSNFVHSITPWSTWFKRVHDSKLVKSWLGMGKRWPAWRHWSKVVTLTFWKTRRFSLNTKSQKLILKKCKEILIVLCHLTIIYAIIFKQRGGIHLQLKHAPNCTNLGHLDQSQWFQLLAENQKTHEGIMRHISLMVTDARWETLGSKGIERNRKILRGTTVRIPNHRAPNQKLTISWAYKSMRYYEIYSTDLFYLGTAPNL